MRRRSCHSTADLLAAIVGDAAARLAFVVPSATAHYSVRVAGVATDDMKRGDTPCRRSYRAERTWRPLALPFVRELVASKRCWRFVHSLPNSSVAPVAAAAAAAFVATGDAATMDSQCSAFASVWPAT